MRLLGLITARDFTASGVVRTNRSAAQRRSGAFPHAPPLIAAHDRTAGPHAHQHRPPVAENRFHVRRYSSRAELLPSSFRLIRIQFLEEQQKVVSFWRVNLRIKLTGFQSLAFERYALVCDQFPLRRKALSTGLQEKAENHCSKCH